MDCNQVIFIYIVCRCQYDLQIVLFVTSCNSTRLSFSRACNLSCSCVIGKVHFAQYTICDALCALSAVYLCCVFCTLCVVYFVLCAGRWAWDKKSDGWQKLQKPSVIKLIYYPKVKYRNINTSTKWTHLYVNPLLLPSYFNLGWSSVPQKNFLFHSPSNIPKHSPKLRYEQPLSVRWQGGEGMRSIIASLVGWSPTAT